jgi:hypothetical protein
MTAAWRGSATRIQRMRASPRPRAHRPALRHRPSQAAPRRQPFRRARCRQPFRGARCRQPIRTAESQPICACGYRSARDGGREEPAASQNDPGARAVARVAHPPTLASSRDHVRICPPTGLAADIAKPTTEQSVIIFRCLPAWRSAVPSDAETHGIEARQFETLRSTISAIPARADSLQVLPFAPICQDLIARANS